MANETHKMLALSTAHVTQECAISLDCTWIMLDLDVDPIRDLINYVW